MAREALRGDRRSIARLISLVEEGRSLRPVMEALLPHTGRAYTVGITGSPGAGKSTLTERLIARARALGKTIGVLAVDPSSPFSGGALLGDRVRMQAHATDPAVFIRSMATRGHLGGLSLATPEAVRVLDASGKEVVIVETVGVGQAEVDIADACDTTVVVVNPGWGDAVQTAKAGLMEIADVFVVNKADRPGADETVRELRQMLNLTAQAAKPPVVRTVAVKGEGITELWDAIDAHRDRQERDGSLTARRRRRIAREVTDIAVHRQRRRIDEGASVLLAELTDEVLAGRLDPYGAADRLLHELDRRMGMTEGSEGPRR
ncbi:MAG TPA: methylmalonyl Co-A mutase-associated GTPase MeaB [Actinomycetota bacterium]|nr:methylmalonyl Co-A mutase-associated GTPase MeaB [Actinomycetota bacterium]